MSKDSSEWEIYRNVFAAILVDKLTCLSLGSQPAKVVYMDGLNTVKVAAGSYHSLVLTDFGQVYSMGLNANGQVRKGGRRSVPGSYSHTSLDLAIIPRARLRL